jgi:hypothetical protein
MALPTSQTIPPFGEMVPPTNQTVWPHGSLTAPYGRKVFPNGEMPPLYGKITMPYGWKLFPLVKMSPSCREIAPTHCEKEPEFVNLAQFSPDVGQFHVRWFCVSGLFDGDQHLGK